MYAVFRESARTCCIFALSIIFPLSIFLSLLFLPVFYWLPTGVQETAFGNDSPEFDGESNLSKLPWGYGFLKSVKELLPKQWGKKYSECDGSHQSPINFDNRHVVNNSLLTEIKFANYDQRPRDNVWTATNNGHTVQFSADFDVSPYITNGGLEKGRYYFRQFHYHWGSNDSYGSEHSVNGKRFPLELHLLHVRNSSDSSPYKMAVIGIFADVVDESVNDTREQEKLEEMRSIVEAAQSVRETGSTKQVYVPGFTLARFLPKKRQFFRYYGSLTTPPCSQTIQWIVMANPIKITRKMLQVFRHLVAHRPAEKIPEDNQHNPNWLRRLETGDEEAFLLDNFRPTQSSNGRAVNYFSG